MAPDNDRVAEDLRQICRCAGISELAVEERAPREQEAPQAWRPLQSVFGPRRIDESVYVYTGLPSDFQPICACTVSPIEFVT